MNEINYKTGDTSTSGEFINKIISATRKCIVFLNKNGEICFEHRLDNMENITKITNKLQTLSLKIPDGLTSEKVSALTNSLATALFNSMINSDSSIDKALSYFDEIEDTINKIVSPHLAKTILIVSNIATTLLIVLFCMVIYEQQTSLYATAIACIGAGSFGSLFSLLQRNSKIEIPLTKGYFYIILQSIFISILGGMSGLIMYILINSRIAFSIFDGNIFSVLLLSIISGFSERLVPDLFSSIDKGNTSA